MDSTRRTPRVAGVLFIITFLTAIPAALLLHTPVLEDANSIVSADPDAGVALGALLEVLLIIANVGTAVVLFPTLKRQNEGLALGDVAARLVECTFIAIGIVSLLSILTLRQDLAGAAGGDSGSLVTVGKSLVAIHDWTFLLGPGFIVGVGNGLILGYLLYRSGLVPPGMALLGSSQVRPLRRRYRDGPRIRLGVVAGHLPDGPGLQALPHHRRTDRRHHPSAYRDVAV